jgi:DNA-binding NtrC family response regulator
MERENQVMSSTILVVDDDISTRRLLFNLLGYQGYDVELVSSGEAALEELKTKAFNLIILDMKLPIMDGFQVLEQMRAMEVNAKVLFITGHGSIDSAIKAIRLGASDYLEKPFNLVELKSVVSQLLF